MKPAANNQTLKQYFVSRSADMEQRSSLSKSQIQTLAFVYPTEYENIIRMSRPETTSRPRGFLIHVIAEGEPKLADLLKKLEDLEN